jgi:Secretion system C-terminal sorting domain/Pregnancy-associated plasma protein-A
MTQTVPFITIILFFFFSKSGFAQDASGPYTQHCASASFMSRHLAEDATMNTHLGAIERLIAASRVQLQTRGDDTSIVIPIVVHIVYGSEKENISDLQITTQIKILNLDFNKLSSEMDRTPEVFKPIAANCHLQFKLAARDPSNHSTSGIMRYNRSARDWGTLNDVKRPDKGGISPWDPSRYLNIWVCNVGDGILGYASFPGCPAPFDGIVVDHTAFGTIGTARFPFNKGRTCVHEIGHWLGLFHTWGDRECGDDLIADTPMQKRSHIGDVTTPQYSDCTGLIQLDMTMNFMEYVNDASMWLFTEGQNKRMRTVLTNPLIRGSIAHSDGAIPVESSTCDTIKKVAAYYVTDKDFTLGWLPIPYVTSYTILFKAANALKWDTLRSEEAQLTITQLQSATQYHFKVKADCRESRFSTSLIVQTKGVEISLPNLTLYPNPAREELQIDFGIKNEEKIDIEVTDVNGQSKIQVKQHQLTQKLTLDMRNLPNGMYFIVITKNDQKFAKRFFKATD